MNVIAVETAVIDNSDKLTCFFESTHLSEIQLISISRLSEFALQTKTQSSTRGPDLISYLYILVYSKLIVWTPLGSFLTLT